MKSILNMSETQKQKNFGNHFDSEDRKIYSLYLVRLSFKKSVSEGKNGKGSIDKIV